MTAVPARPPAGAPDPHAHPDGAAAAHPDGAAAARAARIGPVTDVVALTDPDDPRLADYTALTDVARRRRHEAAAGVCVVEGDHALRHAVRAGVELCSVLLADTRVEAMGDVVRAAGARRVPVYVAPPSVMDRVAGFRVHRGVLAAAPRPPAADVAALLAGARRLAVLEDVNDHENVGVLYRAAAALGVDGVLLSPLACDPLYRRSIRVSMGHTLTLPTARLAPWPAALTALRAAGFVLAALTPAGTVDVDDPALRAAARLALLLGAEGPGLTPGALDLADVRAAIPMAGGVDSLNVASAAAIAFHASRPLR